MADTITKDLGASSAYAYAVEKGYTGTEEEFAKEQANFAKNAQQVATDRAATEKARENTEQIRKNALSEVGAAKTSALQEIAQTGEKQVDAVRSAGAAQVSAVQDAGTDAVGMINQTADDRIDDINKAAAEKKEEIEGLDLVEEVNQLSTAMSDLANVPHGWIEGFYINASYGAQSENSDYKCTDFVPLWRNGVFFPIAYDIEIVHTMGVSLYDENKNYIRTITTDSTSGILSILKGIVTCDDGAAYLRASSSVGYDAKLSYANIGGVVIRHPTLADGAVSTDKIANNAITPEKTTFIRSHTGANLFDKDSMAIDESWYYGTGAGQEIKLQTNQYTTKYSAIAIPVENPGKITLKQQFSRLYGYWCVDEQNICTSEFAVAVNEYLTDGYTINVPDNATKVLLSILYYKSQDDVNCPLMVAYGIEAKDYEPYEHYYYLDGVKVPDDESEADKENIEFLKLPERYTLVVGDTFELFYRGVVNAVTPDMYDVVIDCAKGNAYSKRFVWTPTAADAGSHTLKVTLYDMEHNMLDEKTVQLIVKEKATSPASAVNVLYVGDSLAVSGAVPAEMKRRLTGTGGTPAADGLGNIEFIGSCENSAKTVRYEGYGGWTFNSYNTAYKSTQYMWITCAGHGKTEADDQHSVYADVNGVKWKLETVEDGKIKIIRTSASGTLPTSGTLTWVSGGTHTENIVYTASEQAAGNPFWDESTEKVDFATYAQRMGASSIGYVYVLLGWNSASTNEESYKSQIRTFVDNVLTSFPNCKIVLLGLQLPARDGLGVNYGATGIYSRYYDLMQHVWNLNQWYADIAAEYPDNVTTVNIAGQFDTENNMPSGTRTVNARSTVTERYQTNGIHPMNDGYMQIADACYRDFVHKLQN